MRIPRPFIKTLFIMKHHRSPILASIALLAMAFTASDLKAREVQFPNPTQENRKKELLELTGGRQVKVTWWQDGKVKYYDTNTDVVKVLPFAGNENKSLLLTSDGKYIVTSVGPAFSHRQIMAYDTETGKVIASPVGPENNLMAVWTDPETGKVWIYVNSNGDKKESWKAMAGPVYRFPLGEPEKRELFWDRTRSHLYLSFSADGSRACFQPGWGNIGELKIAKKPDGQTDQDNSGYKKYGGGCFPSIAPDNSYRMFILHGSHREIMMYDEGGANPREIPVDGMLKNPHSRRGGARSVWLTHWSTDARYLTLMGPEHDSELHGVSQIFIGLFDDKFTEVEKWVQVSDFKDGKCRRSHAWVAPTK